MNNPVIVAIGETLWDVFPDGARLGGAPLNFSCSLAGLAPAAAKVFMVSAVGDDDLGGRAIESLRTHDVETSQMQISQRPTGQVLVELDSAGVASYRFAENTAWDALDYNTDLEQLAADCQVVCFGTLGQRSEMSRSTIQRFIAATPQAAIRILDVNLRPPFYSDEVIQQSLQLASVLKLNDDELPTLAKLCGAAGDDLQVMRALAERYQLDCVALTRGAKGALLVTADAQSDLSGTQVDVVDTVGAGDAFTAAMALGMLGGKDVDQINSAAIAAAAYVCTQPGATVRFPDDLKHVVAPPVA